MIGGKVAAPLGILLTLADYRLNVTEEIGLMIRGYYGRLVFKAEIHYNTPLLAAGLFIVFFGRFLFPAAYWRSYAASLPLPGRHYLKGDSLKRLIWRLLRSRNSRQGACLVFCVERSTILQKEKRK